MIYIVNAEFVFEKMLLPNLVLEWKFCIGEAIGIMAIELHRCKVWKSKTQTSYLW